MVDVFRIEPDGVYDDATLGLWLGLSAETLAKARRNGALRYSRQGHRILYLGRWLLAWLDGDQPAATRAGVSMSASQEIVDDRLALRARDAARLIGVSERTLFSLTKAGQIAVVRIGRLVLYRREALEDFLRRHAGQAPGDS